MSSLPDEIWTEILDYLDPHDIISSQRVSSRLLKVARDPPLWRYKCFEKAPSAAQSHASRPNALAALTGALGGLSLGDTTETSAVDRASLDVNTRTQASRRAKAVAEWDGSHRSERIDWYSEYVGRHAPLSTEWSETNTPAQEVKGMALFQEGEKVVSPLEDGSIVIWRIQEANNGRRKLTEQHRSRKGLLFQDMSTQAGSSASKVKTLGSAVDNISIDSKRMRAYISADDCLNEVDLERMEVIAQSKYAWPITALSQENIEHDSTLTIGTSWSLHLHDPRLSLESHFTSLDVTAQVDLKTRDDSIAFLPNYTKFDTMQNTPYVPELSSDLDSDSHRRNHRGGLKAFARVEPGPQSILHQGENEILIAGRMPSILFYDRRYFPQLQSVIHSGARLSSMTILPVPPSKADPNTTGKSTLIACGEYGGCGSLEIYELPHQNKNSQPEDNTLYGPLTMAEPSALDGPYRYKNRQQASSSKLLSVATQGTRIVFSDAEGTLKWVERDGRGLARRWNINAYAMTEQSSSIQGEQCVRKMIALPELDSQAGSRGDGDLLIWTGEKLGIVTTKPKAWEEVDHDELVKAFEEKMDLNTDGQMEKDKEYEYAKIMRQALERQADERRWMSRFGVRRW